MSALSEIMDGLATLAEPLTPQVYAFPPLSVTPPCVVIGYPTMIDYDETFVRGSDRFELPVWFMVAQAGTLAARDAVFDVMTDVASIKGRFDGNHAFGSVRVTDAAIEEVSVGPIQYLSAKFTVDIVR